MLSRILVPLALVVGAASPVAAQAPGTQLPKLQLSGLTQTEASSFDDLYGRALLIEFFAYW